MSVEQPTVRLLRVPGLLVWAMVGLPVLASPLATRPAALLGWAVAYVTFGVALMVTLQKAGGPSGLVCR